MSAEFKLDETSGIDSSCASYKVPCRTHPVATSFWSHLCAIAGAQPSQVPNKKVEVGCGFG